ncbi:MAG: TPM domain-containing protein [Polyangia bacterium]
MAKRSKLDAFLPITDQKRVVEAIHAAEQKTCGEIKVHIDAKLPAGKTPYERAIEVFAASGLGKTREQNAVLVYIASEDRRHAMIGDVGIHAEVGDAFWATAIEALGMHFKRGAYGDGLVAAVQAVGERLAARFPRTSTDAKENQLSDDISTDETLKRS